MGRPRCINYSPEIEYDLSSRLTLRDRSTGLPHLTPEENQNLINHYLTVVKQQRADNPPPPPFVDPLTPDERLDGIIKTVLANQESRLDQQIDFNRSLREYRAVKKMEATARRDSIYEFMIYLTSELLKDPRPTLHSRDFDAALFKKKSEKLEKILSNDKHNPLYTQNLATFNIRFERYQEASFKLRKSNLKIERRTAQTENIALPAPEVTAKKSITEKPIDKKEKATKKKLLPLDSSIGDLSISSFTTEPYFEDLEPTTNLPSPVLKKITRKPVLPILSDSEDELDEAISKIRSRSSKSRRNRSNTPDPGDYPRTPLDGRKSSLQRDGERIRERGQDSGSGNHPDPHQKAGEDPRQVPEGDLERRQEINLGSGSTEPARPPEAHPEQGDRELRQRMESLGREEEGLPALPKNKKRPKSDKRNQPRQSGSNRQTKATRTTEAKLAQPTVATKPARTEAGTTDVRTTTTDQVT
ncbi:hypothetical protein KEM48_011932 [Puccinia striiformis f. sp. tritici PST-130]|nr:hypothetical protein KEM48_011932 [Puccinia striiformis f. sp. tritici PST-130]